jgi:hypothetical protein
MYKEMLLAMVTAVDQSGESSSRGRVEDVVGVGVVAGAGAGGRGGGRGGQQQCRGCCWMIEGHTWGHKFTGVVQVEL